MEEKKKKKIEIKNKSPEALDLLRERVIVYSVPRHLIRNALGLNRKKNLKKEEKEKEEEQGDEIDSNPCHDPL